MADDRELLIRLLEHLESTPRPRGWIARFRRTRAIRRARAMLHWDEARAEGLSCLNPMRNAQASSFAVMYVVLSVTTLVRTHHALTIGRIALILGTLAIPFGFGVWFMFTLGPKSIWRANERQYALSLDEARALSAPASRPALEATA
jgi:hypothetical protein